MLSPLAAEYPVERSRTKKMTTIYSDIAVRVGKRDIYHFECEIRYNRAMILRMLEYDVHIALEYQTHEAGTWRSGNRPVLERV